MQKNCQPLPNRDCTTHTFVLLCKRGTICLTQGLEGSLVFRVSPSNVGPVPAHLLLLEPKRRTFLQGQGEGRECTGRKGRRGGGVPMHAPSLNWHSLRVCACMNVGFYLPCALLGQWQGCKLRCGVTTIQNQGRRLVSSFQSPS